jgi:serine/threonine protein kinase
MSEHQKHEDKDATQSVGSFGPNTPSDRVPSLSEVEQPTYFGRYRVEKLLAIGGFGAVYRAWDDELNRTVAIKLVRSERISESSQKSFLDEARVVAGLNHPNIVTAFDIGRTEQGDYFFVSRFVDGADLNNRMQQHAISQRHAIEIVAEIADALNHAHSQGLVHRDVKPANILIDSKGRAYLTDFGIALQEQAIVGDGKQFVGTPEYMSPEQLRGESHRVDHRSDIYSLGLVLYRLLAGRGPFRYQSIDELIDKVSSGEVRTPRVFNAGIDVELERICLRALARKPNDRYTVALDFAEDLRWLLTSSSNEELTDRSSRTPHSNRASKIQTPEFTQEHSGTSDGGTIELGANVNWF